MPKLLQINPVLRMNTSTGRIMQEIGDVAMSAGWESFVAYSKGRDGMRESTSKTVPVGNRFSVAVHGLGTRLFDRHGLASNGATKAFIKKINDKLSRKRAEAVYECLTKEFGVPESLLEIGHKGGVENMFYDDPALSRAAITKAL